MATSDFLGSVPPELLARVLRTGQLGTEEEALRQRMARGQSLQQQGAQRYSNPWAAALGGLAGALRTGVGAYEETQAQKGLESLGKERTAGREAFVSGLGAAEQQGKQQEAGALLSQRPFVPFATDYNAESLKLRDATATAGAQQRQQGARNLAVLSGDPVLKQWAMMQASGEGGDTELQRARLEQSGQRLSLAQEAEKRKAGVLERTLSFREQQAKQQREDRERAAAAKKVADALGVEEGLRKEVMGNPVTRSFLEAQVAFDKVQRAAQDPSAAGDLALIFGVMKTLDPGSTVREGEFATAQNASGIDGRVVAAYNRILNGERLSPQQRADFVRTAQGQFSAQQQGFQQLVNAYRGVAERAGANVQNVIPLAPGAARAPAAGGGAPVTGPDTQAPVSGPTPTGKRVKMPDGTSYDVMSDGSTRKVQ